MALLCTQVQLYNQRNKAEVRWQHEVPRLQVWIERAFLID